MSNVSNLSNGEIYLIKFALAVEHLKISEYKSRIYNSNSRCELMHLNDYIQLSEIYKNEDTTNFSEWFRAIVEEAELQWKRPESVFQHILKFFMDAINRNSKKDINK